MELLKKYDIKSIRGNSEEYCLLGVNSFDYVINNPTKKQSQEWTMSQLKPSHLTQMKLYPVSFELLMGGKRLDYVILAMMCALTINKIAPGVINQILIIL